MDAIYDFLSLSNPNVLVGAILLSTSSSMIGTVTFLKRRTLINDAISHAVLPGTCLAFF